MRGPVATASALQLGQEVTASGQNSTDCARLLGGVAPKARALARNRLRGEGTGSKYAKHFPNPEK